MSEITMKTMNSYKNKLTNTPERSRISQNTEKSSSANGAGSTDVRLESLGKTRKSEKGADKKENNDAIHNQREEQREVKAIEVTQDDTESVMSEITLKKKDENKDDNKENENMATKKKDEDSNADVDDTYSLMSGITNEMIQEEIESKEIQNGESKNYQVDREEKEENEKSNNIQDTTHGDLVSKNEKGNNGTANDDDRSVMSEITKINEKHTVASPVKEKKGQTSVVENPYNTPTRTKSASYLKITKKSVEEYKVSEENEDTVRKSNKQYIRIRFSFTKQKYQGPKMEYVKRLLYELVQCAKAIDPKAGISVWDDEFQYKDLNGNEIKMLPTELCKYYVDLPATVGEYNDGVTYYGNGVRLISSMDLDEFINKWNYKKYDRSYNNPFRNWKSIKAAEAQGFAHATAVGYLQGSVENGFYSTIKEYLKKKYNGKVEVSYQTIYQPGITQKIWNEASKKAKETNEDVYSRDFKRVKFAHAPTALIVYANSPTDIDKIRKEFMTDYGEREGQWPLMPDHSRMRFIPLVNGYIKKKEVRDKMFENLRHQAVSKAGDVYLDLKYKDLTSVKDYLGNKSLEQVIHDEKRSCDKDIPIFKHITMRWDNRQAIMVYEVAVACSLLEEAKEALLGLNNKLIRVYGKEVRQHFHGVPMGSEEAPTIRKRNFTMVHDECDKEIELFMQRNTTSDKLSKVLIEGMEQLKEMDNKDTGNAPAMLIVTPGNEEEKQQKEKEVIEIDQDESLTSEEESKKSDSTDETYIPTSEWDKIELAKDFEQCVPASMREIRRALNTIGGKHITIDEVVSWKRNSPDELQQMVDECEGKEYSVMKRIVHAIETMKEEKEEIVETTKEPTRNSKNDQQQQQNNAGDEAGVSNSISEESLTNHANGKHEDSKGRKEE